MIDFEEDPWLCDHNGLLSYEGDGVYSNESYYRCVCCGTVVTEYSD